jgi:hypothetical protein
MSLKRMTVSTIGSRGLPARAGVALLGLVLALTAACAHGELKRTCDLDLRAIGDAIEIYAVDHKALPESLEQLVPKYLKSVRLDPWGSAYQYVRESPRYRVTSLGPDKALGTADDQVRTAVISVSN